MRRLTTIMIALAAILPAACSQDTAPRPAAALPEPRAPFTVHDGTVADRLDCLRDEDITLISAHRGGLEPGYPENAIETFANTLRQFPMVIETDIRETKDGVLILLHDDDLERTTTGTGDVDEKSWSQIKDLRLVDDNGQETDFRIPTLDDALEWGRGRAILQLDVKRGVSVAKVARRVAEADAQSYAAVIVYTRGAALAAARANPDVTLSIEITDMDFLDGLNAEGISDDRVMAWTGLTDQKPDLWQALADRGISAAFGTLWTLDSQIAETGDDALYARLANRGVDVIATDRHHEAYQALRTRQDTVSGVEACTR